jgi:hypothetical protein
VLDVQQLSQQLEPKLLLTKPGLRVWLHVLLDDVMRQRDEQWRECTVWTGADGNGVSCIITSIVSAGTASTIVLWYPPDKFCPNQRYHIFYDNYLRRWQGTILNSSGQSGAGDMLRHCRGYYFRKTVAEISMALGYGVLSKMLMMGLRITFGYGGGDYHVVEGGGTMELRTFF